MKRVQMNADAKREMLVREIEIADEQVRQGKVAP